MRTCDPAPGTTHDARLCLFVAVSIAGVTLTACDGGGARRQSSIDALPRLAADADMRIGDVHDPDVGFSRVGGVDVDREGNIFVLEAAVPEIRTYGPDGTIRRRIGRRGGGPGEFESVPWFGVAGDTIWTVHTRGVSRIALFDRDGNVLATGRSDGVVVPLPERCGVLFPRMMRPDGTFASHFGRVSDSCEGLAVAADAQPDTSARVPIVRFDAFGNVIDTIGWTGRPPPRMWTANATAEFQSSIRYADIGGRRKVVPTPPMARPWLEAMTDGYLLVDTPLAETQGEGVITVTRFGLDEDTVYHRVLRYEPDRYSAAELDTIAARAARREPGGMLPVETQFAGRTAAVPDDWEVIARALRAEMRFPEFKLPLRTVWVAQDQSVWLRRDDGDAATARWIVLDPGGEPRGQLELPSSVRIVWSRGDRFWAVVPDENDVEWIERFRMRAG